MVDEGEVIEGGVVIVATAVGHSGAAHAPVVDVLHELEGVTVPVHQRQAVVLREHGQEFLVLVFCYIRREASPVRIPVAAAAVEQQVKGVASVPSVAVVDESVGAVAPASQLPVAPGHCTIAPFVR